MIQKKTCWLELVLDRLRWLVLKKEWDEVLKDRFSHLLAGVFVDWNLVGRVGTDTF